MLTQVLNGFGPALPTLPCVFGIVCRGLTRALPHSHQTAILASTLAEDKKTWCDASGVVSSFTMDLNAWLCCPGLSALGVR